MELISNSTISNPDIDNIKNEFEKLLKKESEFLKIEHEDKFLQTAYLGENQYYLEFSRIECLNGQCEHKTYKYKNGISQFQILKYFQEFVDSKNILLDKGWKIDKSLSKTKYAKKLISAMLVLSASFIIIIIIFIILFAIQSKNFPDLIKTIQSFANGLK